MRARRAQPVEGARRIRRRRRVDGRRSLVISWLNRGTLHLVRPDDYWWLHPLTTPQLATANRRRLAQEGVSAAQARRGVDVVVEPSRAHGPQTRTELRRRLAAARVPVAGTGARARADGRVAAAARSCGDHCADSEHAFVAVDDWLGPRPDPMDHDDALARLARRYLRGHGPADARDLAKWAGLTLGDAPAVRSTAPAPISSTAPTGSSTSPVGGARTAPDRDRACSGRSTRCSWVGVARALRRAAHSRDDERDLPSLRARRRSRRRYVGTRGNPADRAAARAARRRAL